MPTPTDRVAPRTPTGIEFAEILRTHDTPHPMAGRRRPINEWIADIEVEARQQGLDEFRQRIMGPDGSQIRSTSAYIGLLAILDELGEAHRGD